MPSPRKFLRLEQKEFYSDTFIMIRPFIVAHHPAENVSQWGCDVGFVGTYEAPRAQSLLYLAENGVSLRVWGNSWATYNGSAS